MYYEEKIIDGVLHTRGTPNGEWIPCTVEQLTNMLMKARNYKPRTMYVEQPTIPELSNWRFC